VLLKIIGKRSVITWEKIKLISKTKNDLWKIEYVGGNNPGSKVDLINRKSFNIIPLNEEGVELEMGEDGKPKLNSEDPEIVAAEHIDNSATKLKDPDAP
jgi:hypothetical protein